MPAAETPGSLRTPWVATLLAASALVPAALAAEPEPFGGGHRPDSLNPLLPGYYADPSILEADGSYYLYATLDPWGGRTLGCWESQDFVRWTYRTLNWPTKEACTSPKSQGAMVWAPSVVRAPNGKFYLYVSVGSEVWVGVAEHPLGPWKNALGDRPLIPGDFKPGFHMIDAEAFIDDDGQAYLYWGSGWNWTNGRCWVVRLKPDMVTFDGEVRDVTPTNYFEAPFVVRRGATYFLMYSQGRTTELSYQVHYATGTSPFGPFTEASNSPILVTDTQSSVLAPGHHAVWSHGGADYILYHRHSLPFDPKFVGRQTCIDRLVFTDDGRIEKVVPTHTGPAALAERRTDSANLARADRGARFSATSASASDFGPEKAFDNNYATRWTPATTDASPTLSVDLGGLRTVQRAELRFEYAWKPVRFLIEGSEDGTRWRPLDTRYAETAVSGSPVEVPLHTATRHLRLRLTGTRGEIPSVIEWRVL